MQLKPLIKVILLLSVAVHPSSGYAGTVKATPSSSLASQGPVPLSVLEAEARASVKTHARVTLDSPAGALVDPADDLEVAGIGHVPNYVRAFSDRPGVSATAAHLMRVVLYSGSVRPELKMAIGIRVAQFNQSPYVGAYLEHTLRSTQWGATALTRMRSGALSAFSPEDRLALNYAGEVTSHAPSISDSDYRAVRGYFSDSQIVEITLSVCYFNYLTRVANALSLPVEDWTLSSAAAPPVHLYAEPAGRITVLDDARMVLLSKSDPSFKDAESRGQSSMGIGLPHGERIMLWAHDVPQAWWNYGRVLGPTVTLPRILMRYTSLAVSTANGCRYCTLHVLLGLKRAGVDPAKLFEMKTDDSALTDDERTVVEFARKLTRTPGSITDEDYRKLTGKFGDKGAADVVFQASYFAFMNRFNDAMNTPSEDLALENYRQLYGADWQR